MTDQQDTAKRREDWDRDGFVIMRNFMSHNQAQGIADNVERYRAEVLPSLPGDAAFYEDTDRPETIKRLQSMEEHDNYFRGLYEDSRFTSLAEKLLEDDVITVNMQWFNKPPQDGKATPPHQDGFYFMLELNEALTMWLALDVVDEKKGASATSQEPTREG